MLSHQISEYLKHVKSGTHAILVYDTLERKHELLFDYLASSSDEGLAYVCSDESPKEIREGMARSGIDVGRLESEGRLTIRNYDEFYIVNGQVDIARIMGQWSNLVRRCVAMGLRGLRATGETSCFFRHGKVRELTRYEYALHRRLGLLMHAICAYNIVDMSNSGYLDAVMPMIRAHDPVILTGPKESLILEPDKVEDKNVESIMQVRI